METKGGRLPEEDSDVKGDEELKAAGELLIKGALMSIPDGCCGDIRGANGCPVEGILGGCDADIPNPPALFTP